MKLTLLTYPSVLVQNLGYQNTSRAFEFGKKLESLATEFSLTANIDKNDVYWMEVTNSDWCQNMVVLYAKVAADWKPTPEIFIMGEIHDENYYPYLDYDLFSYLKGGGHSINNIDNPPTQAHKLYRSKKV